MNKIVRKNADYIREATEKLGFDSARFRRFPADEARIIYERAQAEFVPVPRPASAWWWEYFPSSTNIHFENGNGWTYLTRIVDDPGEHAWFIAEDWCSPGYSVWEATVKDIQAIIGECCGFEYYLIDQDLAWLVCENHHNVVIAVGTSVEKNLNKLRSG